MLFPYFKRDIIKKIKFFREKEKNYFLTQQKMID